ncbi:uncharacterized protein LOC124274985 isoform X3 [Haliotis rubra]|uniref:uncharacterized protein LOC124274985 isoform X3 n=1 Tax=Haliotis rubra TaxID=36100 RepID=UPI001EE5DB55|nr:uncharacterized protein LOC124274985 isoform X3 [Haliotis rubra]
MFIETLEFTIPIDLCDLFSTLKRGPRSNLEFPASVNSYGTTQDANIQVALRSNKLTFKVDGVSSNSSMISKSECKTLKLSVFDVDCSLSGAEYEQVTHMVSQPIYSAPHVIPAKRSRDRPSPMKSPPSKTSRSSFQETKHQNIPLPSPDPLQSKSMSETVSVKLEPDLIEIEPDSEQYGDESNQSIDRRHNTQAALDRLSHPQSSHSQSSASSSSSFHQNVPHVPDYAEPSTSQGDHHGDQNIDDYVVYQQEDDDYGEDNDNSALISEMMVTRTITVCYMTSQWPTKKNTDSLTRKPGQDTPAPSVAPPTPQYPTSTSTCVSNTRPPPNTSAIFVRKCSFINSTTSPT